MFAVILSDESPKNPDEAMRLACQGNHNIWYDKAMTIIVFKNGKAAFNGEHSCSDAPVPSRVLSDASKYALRQNYDVSKSRHSLSPNDGDKDILEAYVAADSAQIPLPKLLQWNLDHSLKLEVKRAVQLQDELNKQHHLKTLKYAKYGKRFITKHFRMGPDSFVQMALQLAYYRDQKRVSSTYESATMRAFRHGRTDTILSLTPESLEFVKAMENTDLDANEKYSAFEAAVRAHQMLAQQTLVGKGCARHLIGLRLAAHEMDVKVPAVFTDASFLKYSTYDLSTSQMLSLFEDYPGFGAPSTTAYGVCYVCSKDPYLLFTVTSHAKCPEKDCVRFAKVLEQVLNDLEALWVEKTNSAMTKL